MDIRTLTKLILKLAGAYILVTVLFSVPNALVAPADYLAPTIAWLVIYALVGLALFWFPGAVANRVVRLEETPLEGSITEE